MLQEPRWLVVWVCLRWSTASVVSQRDRWIRDGRGRLILGMPLMSTCWPEVAWLLFRFQNKLLTTVIRLCWVPLVQEGVHTCGQSVSSSQMAKVSMFLTVPQAWIELSVELVCMVAPKCCETDLTDVLIQVWEDPQEPICPPPHTQTHTQGHMSWGSHSFSDFEGDSESSPISNWNISCTESLNVWLLLFTMTPGVISAKIHKRIVTIRLTDRFDWFYNNMLPTAGVFDHVCLESG